MATKPRINSIQNTFEPGRWYLYQWKKGRGGDGRWHLHYNAARGSGHELVCRNFPYHDMALSWMLREQKRHAQQYANDVGVLL